MGTTVTRDPTQVPFSSDSVWNLPLGSGAQWQFNSQLAGQGVFVNTVSTGFEQAIYTSSASDTVVTVTSDGSWGGGAGTWTLHIPAGAQPTTGGDHHLGVDDTSTDTWYSFGNFQRTSPTTATASAGSAKSDFGNGLINGNDDWDFAVGTLRESDLAAGTIDHMLRFTLPPNVLMSWDPNNVADLAPYAWPQTREDGFANGAGIPPGEAAYTGTVPFGITMGIPQGVAEPADIKANAGANMLWQELQTHGAMIRDSSNPGNPNATFYVDQNVNSSDPLLQGMEQFGNEIMSAARILTNQGPNNVNGGGTPVAALDAPLSDAPGGTGGGGTGGTTGPILIKPGSGSFTDAAGNVYTLDAAGNADENGAAIPNGSGTEAMELANGIVYGQDRTTGSWYTWNQQTWAPSAAPPPIVVTPPPPPPSVNPPGVVTGTGSDSLVLTISEDAYQGDAQFTVSVDGKQQGGTFTTTAVKSLGETQTFTFNSDWAPGSHTVAVNFLNDAWAGTPTTDRNLYVNGAVYDGATTGASLGLFSAGTQTFTVNDTTSLPAPTPPPPPPMTDFFASAGVGFFQAAGNTYSIDGSGNAIVNGSAIPGGAGTSAMADFNGQVFGQDAGSKQWYSLAQNNWTAIAPTIMDVTSAGTLNKVAVRSGTFSENGDTFVLSTGNVAQVTLGAGNDNIGFIGGSASTVTGGSGQSQVLLAGGNNSITAGSGSLDVAAGGDKDGYVFHSGNGLLTIEDFSLTKGDTLTVDKSLQGAAVVGSDGNGGTQVMFGAGHIVDLKGVTGFTAANIHFS